MLLLTAAVLAALSARFVPTIVAQDTLGLANGFTTFSTPAFNLTLVSDSQTAYSLRPVGSNFHFIPSDMMSHRQGNNQYHLGDIKYRARLDSARTWTSVDSSAARSALSPDEVSGDTLASANLAPTLNSTLLDITRRWVVEDNTLKLLFDVSNPNNEDVIIGDFGAPLEFNNIFTGRTAEDTNTKCSLTDPYIGQDAGFVQVTPLLGTLPPLVVIPAANSPLEGWSFLTETYDEATAYQSQVFEGLYEWLFHSSAYAENEWASTDPWNAPTSFTLAPGANRTYGLQFILADSIPTIEDALIDAGHPVAAGIPGYILPADQTGKLFLNSPSAVANISVSPAGALTWSENNDSDSWVGYDIKAVAWGRARLSITYADGKLQTVHYYVTHDAVQTIADMGEFLTTDAWFDDTSDPFGRAPSIITYDREANEKVLNDPRVWISGLSDEGGVGAWLAEAMKLWLQPNDAEVQKFETFINQTVWGTLQNSDGSVKKSVFYYAPGSVDYTYPSNVEWGNWWSWDRAGSYDTGRGYDYVHVIAAHWAMYRVARNYPDFASIAWDWSLDKAVLTVDVLTNGSVGYRDVGLMGETVIFRLLEDLKREGWTTQASLVEERMKARQSIWSGQRYPFGSEMAWDSTGQEGVFIWSRWFDDSETAANTIASIIAYQPLIPHWGYNGNARRYWDNIYGGKLQRVERQIHHYGSGLNALPLLYSFLDDPSNYFYLRLGYAGISGALSSVDEGGFPSASFHSFADTLKWDGYTGDYGPNFLGHAIGMGTYIVNHPDFGWQAFGGTITASGDAVEVDVLDDSRRAVFIAPIAALLQLDSGAFEHVTYEPSTGAVTLTIVDAVGAGSPAPQGRLRISQTVDGFGGSSLLKPTEQYDQDAEAWSIPFSGGQATVHLST